MEMTPVLLPVYQRHLRKKARSVKMASTTTATLSSILTTLTVEAMTPALGARKVEATLAVMGSTMTVIR
jgi:hypothetical protein